MKKSVPSGDIRVELRSKAIEMANWFSAAWIASLLDEHSGALELFAAQWTDAPEDCVQDAILELTRQPSSPRNVAAWLFHVVRLRAISANRSAVRRRRHEGLAARLVRASSDHREAPFDAEELALALDLLDDEIREVVFARVWGGLGFAEIAAMVGLSAATTFRRYEAGLKTLRERLEARCNKTNSSKASRNSPAT